MRVPFLDLQAQYLEIKPEVDTRLDGFLKAGSYIGGAYLKNFEENFSSFLGASYCIGVANGLDALEISLKSLGIGVGDEVIVPSNTFIATWLAVSNCGATPIPVEPKHSSFSIDPAKIESAISKNTKAIIPVHLYGEPADLDLILEIAETNNLFVVEDAAQAHGAFYKSKRIGSHGDLVAWSFYPGKNLGAFGDGGAVTTNNLELAKKIRKIGNYGSQEKYINDVIGRNSRLDPMQALILDIKLKKLDEWNDRRRKIANKYLSELSDIDITLPDGFNLQDGAWHLFPILVNKRDALKKYLDKNLIETLIHYPIPPHKQMAYASDFSSSNLEIAEKLSSQLLSLPIGPQLEIDQVDFVIKILKKYFN